MAKTFKPGEFRLGPTGQYPQGSLEPEDDGEINMALVVDYQHGIVRVIFGSPVAWFGLPAENARALAQQLVEMAEKLERRKT